MMAVNTGYFAIVSLLMMAMIVVPKAAKLIAIAKKYVRNVNRECFIG